MGKSKLNLQCSGVSNKTSISEELKIGAEFFPTDAWHNYLSICGDLTNYWSRVFAATSNDLEKRPYE